MIQNYMVTAMISLIGLLCAPNTTYACQFNTDCDVGSKCLKTSGSLHGVCAGGLNPGNRYDKKPVYNPLDLNIGNRRNDSTGDARGRMDANGTYGDTCSFNTDCGVGRKCVKSGSLYGTCM